MKIMKLNKTSGLPGNYGGVIQLGIFLDDIKLKHKRMSGGAEEYILSLRDEHWLCCLPKPEEGWGAVRLVGSYSLGKAHARLTEKIDNGGRRMVSIAIEGSDVADFVDLYKEVYGRLRIPHEEISTPKRDIEEISFIKGIGNDLKKLGQFAKNRWQVFSESVSP